jgi:hypothetical protein
MLTRARWCLVGAVVVSAFAAGGVAGEAAALKAGTSLSAPGSKAGPSAPALVKFKRSVAVQSDFGATIPRTSAHKPLTGAACTPLFSIVASPNASGFDLLTTDAALSPTDIWAVGFSNAGGGAADRNLAEHWNGTAWTVVGTPNAGAGFNDLNGVAAIDSNDVWAVGNAQSGSTVLNLALHWNGSNWAGVATPQPGSGQFLTGVSALGSKNVWAAGAYANGSGVLQNLVLQWDGTSWTQTLPPNAGAGDNILQTIFATSANDIWVVGQYLVTAGISDPTTNPWQTLIEHYNGSGWTIQTSLNPVAGDNTLVNISASASGDAWAVGFTNTAAVGSARTLIEHWNGTAWSTVASPNFGAGDNVLSGLLALSANNAWTSGFGKLDAAPTTGGTTLVEHWDGTSWTIQSSDSPGASGDSLNGLAALPDSQVWAVGDSYSSINARGTMIQQFQLPAPTSVAAVAGDNSASITWTPESCNGGFATTGYQVTAWDGCNPQLTLPAASSPFVFNGVTNGSPFTFTVQAVSASLGAETPSAASNVVTPAGATATAAFSACSRQQYQYVSPNPTNFVDIDTTHLTLTVTPAVASFAVITGNADLWTANAGLNQDLGLNVVGGTFGAGTVVGWKESGGFAGTFSPNAAAVQSVVSLAASTAYTVSLQWKSNQAFPGAAIFAGAGPLPGGAGMVSPTRLTVHLVPVSAATVVTVSTNKQYTLTGSGGATWTDMDSTLLTTPVNPSVPSVAVITGNADLFTANAGFNQDIAISVDGNIAAWKESGGFAGTFSPNAAFVETTVGLTAAAHSVKLQWKTNKAAPSGTIYAGAGPWPAATTSYSPTSLTIVLVPVGIAPSKAGAGQYQLLSSDGAGWTPIDSTFLVMSVAPGAAASTYSFSGNADLWTANAGFNQDIAIIISGGVYGSGTVVAWKESGGFAGTFSPNAAYVETVQHLQGGTTYTVWLAWKTNRQAAGAQIFAGAGPWPSGGPSFSPTTLTETFLSTP